MASWLRGHCHYSPRAAALLVRNGRALAHLPVVAAACAGGLITADQLAVIAPITSPANLAAAAEQGADLAGIDRVLAEGPPGRATTGSPRRCTTTGPGSIPTAPNPTPPRADR